MKTNFLCCIIFLVLPLTSLAQSRVKGIVHDDEGKPLIGANVFLVNPQNEAIIKGTLTDATGHYVFQNIPVGTFQVEVTMIGFAKGRTARFSINNAEEVTLPVLGLSRESKKLTDVTVSAKKQLFEQKVDRTVINVQASINSAGGTALEVLEKSPGVVVDRQNNSISMNGKDGIVVMINGKINHMPLSAVVQMLSGMTASTIEKIELITNPPANYDAEGNAGYINIVLKSNPNAGTNGSYTLTAGYNKDFVPGGSINFNHRKEKVNWSGNYSFNNTPLFQQFDFYRRVSRPNSTLENITLSDREAAQRNHNGKLSFSYDLDTNTTIGALVSSYDNKWSMDAINNNAVMINSIMDTSINIVNDEVNQWRHYMGNLNIEHKFKGKSNQRITADFDYLYYSDNNPVNYVNSYYGGTGSFLYDQKTKSEKKTPITVLVGKADFSRSL